MRYKVNNPYEQEIGIIKIIHFRQILVKHLKRFFKAAKRKKKHTQKTKDNLTFKEATVQLTNAFSITKIKVRIK